MSDDDEIERDDELDPEVTAAGAAELAAEEAGHRKPEPAGMTDEELSHSVDKLPDPPDPTEAA
jgi:hypothetical protein